MRMMRILFAPAALAALQGLPPEDAARVRHALVGLARDQTECRRRRYHQTQLWGFLLPGTDLLVLWEVHDDSSILVHYVGPDL